MENLNWDDSRIFLVLAREGTLSAAARHLKTGVATVSRRIERLEHALGVPLFLRHQSGYVLTDQGEALLPSVEAVELAMTGMRKLAAEEAGIRGLVRLASVESLVDLFVVPALSPLLLGNPGLDVEILFSTATVNMHRHDADLALRMVRPEAGNLRFRQLAEMGFGLYGPIDGTRPNRMVTWPHTASLAIPIGWATVFAGRDAPRFTVNTLSGQIEAVRHGVGQAVLPHFLARESGLRLISDRLPDGEKMQRPVFLVTQADVAASRRITAVSEAIGDEVVRRRHELSEP